jgi:hypothetical protein
MKNERDGTVGGWLENVPRLWFEEMRIFLGSKWPVHFLVQFRYILGTLLTVFRMVSCWDFIAFGTMYASQFTLIHSEYQHPWDHFYEALGIGMWRGEDGKKMERRWRGENGASKRGILGCFIG